MNIRSCLLCVLFILSGCVSTPANYKPAGFQSADEAREYIPDYLYYAKKLTIEDWEAFYRRFPEYWKDVQTAKTLGGTVDFHPWYTAYSFKWNTLRRRQDWDSTTVSRLGKKQVQKGDDIFKVIFALGVPGRVVWDNDFEILAYRIDSAIVFSNGVFDHTVKCSGCFMRYDQNTREGMSEQDVINTLDLKRPKY